MYNPQQLTRRCAGVPGEQPCTERPRFGERGGGRAGEYSAERPPEPAKTAAVGADGCARYCAQRVHARSKAARSEAPAVELQWVLDDIMAFWGSFDDAVPDEHTRNLTKVGAAVERVSLMLRLDWKGERLSQELEKLLNRLYKTGLTPQPEPLEVLNRRVLRGEEIDRVTLLNSVEGLFRV